MSGDLQEVPLVEFAPAKVNLFLAVHAKRPDGYHELKSLMCPITLGDRITLEVGGDDIVVVCKQKGVPTDETNLVHLAAKRFFEAVQCGEGVVITIDKKIPVAAGLGGGSSDAAAVLKALNRYYKRPLKIRELMTIALSIGADVPFFVMAQAAIATGIGQILNPITGLQPAPILLVNPGFFVSTKAVYENLNLGLTKCRKKHRYLPLNFTQCEISSLLCNDLESVVAAKFPAIKAIKAALLAQGARGVLMTGSGPTVFGLFSGQEAAQKAFAKLRLNSSWKIYLSRLLTEGL